jgi:hypothetical protein
MRETISEVVAEENSSGNYDVFYAHYSYYEGGYVNEGHPNVATHYAIANELITAIDTINAWEPYNDIKPPAFTKLPDSPFTVYDTYYNLNVETDSYSTVRYSTEDKPYSEMENDFTTTGKRKHYVTIPCQHGQQYTYYLRASDLSGNLMDTSAVITFNVDTTKSIAPWWHVNFNDSEWEEGMAPLGFGNGGEVTEIARVQTAYFRKFFQVDDPSSHSRISAILQYDNGGIVYVNGVEIGRVNMPPDEIDYNTDAESNISGNISFPLTSDDLRNGTNIIAVEIHQNIVDTSDFIFDLRLRSSSQIFIDNGSNWKYYDNGNEPENQIVSIEFNRLNDVLPSKFQLFQNYPNPFNPLTTISFDILKNNHVTLTIFDLLGREVKTLFEGRLNSGSYEFKFDGSNLASGEYFYRLQSEDFTEVKKLILFK